MYTLEQLQQKNLLELKEIGHQLNVLPDGDRRLKRNWIKALAGVKPPLLQLLEVSPAEVEPVSEAIEVQATEPIEPAPPTSPESPDEDYLDCPKCHTVRGLYAYVWETRCTSCDYMEPCIRHPFEDVRPFKVDRVRVQEPLRESPAGATDCPFCGAVHALYSTKDYLDRPEIRCLHCNYSRFKNYPGAIRPEAQEPPFCRPETKDGIDLQDFTVQVQEPPIESKFGRIVYPRPGVKTEPKVSQSAIAEPESTERDRFVSIGSKRFLAVEPVMQEAIDTKTFGEPDYPDWPEGWLLAAENSLDADLKSVAHHFSAEFDDLNPILTGITLSDKFLAAYLPPNFSADYDAELDGQLKLLDRVTDPEPPDPDHYSTLAQFWAVMNAWNATYTDSVEQFKDWDIPQQNNVEFIGTDTERKGAREVSVVAPATAGRDICSQHDGASIPSHDEGLGSQKGDRILEGSRNNPGDCRGTLPHQSPQLAACNDEQPPNRGDGRKAPTRLKVGMEVGHKTGSHLGEILKIYYSQKRRKWRAKVGAAHYDTDSLLEQQIIPWDFPKPMGNWQKTGSTMRNSEACDIWTRKQQPAPKATTNWTLQELAAKPIWQLKAIALEVCERIPGCRSKKSYIRAILAEQIFQERPETAVKPAPKPAVKSRKKSSDAIGLQLSLDLVAV